MNESGPKLDTTAQIRKEFEKIKDKTIERPLMVATEAFESTRAAVAFFNLGLKLGTQTSEEGKALSNEIKQYMEAREKQLAEAIRHSTKKHGG